MPTTRALWRRCRGAATGSLALSRRAPDAPGEGTAPKVRLAVLPFSNLSEERGQDYFADGLTEEMITQLGHLCRGRIGVISRSSSMVFKERGRPAGEVGRALRADYLLEGSIRREGDRVRITARLVETAGETHLWVESYEPRLTDYLSVQKDVAARIANSLTMELIPDVPVPCIGASSNASAYQAYLKGRYYWNMVADQGAIRRSPTSIRRYGSIRRSRRRMRRCPVRAFCRRSITVRCRARRSRRRGSRPSGPSIWSRPCSKRIWRSATFDGCSSGTGTALKPRTPRRSC